MIRAYGHYERAGTVERVFSPYQGRSLRGFGSQPPASPYDLSQPGRVKEIKDVLIALANRASDVMQNPTDPQTEEIWKFIHTGPQFDDAWDGETADEFLLAVGRYKNQIWGTTDHVFAQLPSFSIPSQPNQTSWVGGPQPTVWGLETLAQAAHNLLHDVPQMAQYLAWRGGVLDLLQWKAGSVMPPEQAVLPTQRQGPAWDPRGFTMADRIGVPAKSNPDLLDQLDLLDQTLQTIWQTMPLVKKETDRQERANAITQARSQRNDLVKKLNAGAPAPGCADPAEIYDAGAGTCVPRCSSAQGTWNPLTQQCETTLPPVEIVEKKPLSALVIMAGVGMVGAAGYLLLRPKSTRPARALRFEVPKT